MNRNYVLFGKYRIMNYLSHTIICGLEILQLSQNLFSYICIKCKHMLKIIADNKIPFLNGVLEPYAQVTYLPGAETTAEIVKDADALITRTRTKCSESVLKDSNVKVIASATIGYDHIDAAFCDANQISWFNAPGCNAGSVKQYVAAALALLSQKTNEPLSGKTLGIVGVGNVGSKVKDLAEAIGLRVLLNDPPRQEKEGGAEFVDLNTIIEEADIITFHVPLVREGKWSTYHLADEAFFKACKNNVIIINSSRGEVVDNGALLEALINEDVKNAVLDVWEKEPDINLELLQKTLIGTSHIAGYSVDGKANGTAQAVNNVSKVFDLPLQNWYPNELPLPENPVITIDVQELSDEQLWQKLVLETYPMHIDDDLLRKHPEAFEKHRGNYMIRREFQAYSVELKNASILHKELLNKMGFIDVQLI